MVVPLLEAVNVTSSPVSRVTFIEEPANTVSLVVAVILMVSPTL